MQKKKKNRIKICDKSSVNYDEKFYVSIFGSLYVW